MVMADSFTTTFRVEAGKMTVRNLPAMAKEISTWKDGEGLMRLERAKATRTAAQNAYLWAVINKDVWTKPNVSGRSLQEDGWTIEDVHEFLKARFLPKHLCVVDHNGEVLDDLVVGGSTVKLSKEAFTEYVANIQQWASEKFGIVLDDPDPYWREKLEAA